MDEDDGGPGTGMDPPSTLQVRTPTHSILDARLQTATTDYPFI